MSFMTDLFEGNFGNLGHDLTAHIGQDLPYYLGAAGLGLGGAGALGLLGGEAAAGGGALSGLFGGGEAAAGGGIAGLEGGLGVAEAGAELTPEISGAFAAAEGGEAASPALQAIEAASGPGQGLGTGFDPSLEQAFTGLGQSSENLGAQAAQEAGMGAPGKEGGFLNNLWEGAKGSLTKNPLGVGAAGLGLGMNMLKGNPDDPKRKMLEARAGELGAQGEQLRNYLSTGTLPPALQAQLDQAKNAAKARILSNHAKSGMSADPNQNSALAQELNAVDMNAVAAMADAQLKMMQTGLSETGLSTQLYEMLTKMDRENNKDLMSAIASFAAALGGGGKGINLKLA